MLETIEQDGNQRRRASEQRVGSTERLHAGLTMSRPQFIRWKPFVDLTGHAPFGRLTVITFVGFNHHHRSQFLVECVCGARKIVLGDSLLTGHCTSCWRTTQQNN
jgi:hypothetical protein